MAKDQVMELETRIDRLEKTVATGFFDHGRRMDRLADRISALESKLDVFAETIRDDLKIILEAVTSVSDEMRRTTGAIRKEHEADRRLTRSILNDHSVRIRELEGRERPEPI